MNAIDQLGISPGHSVLDLGCGNGEHSKYARTKTTGLVVELDIDLSNLRQLQPETDTAGVQGLCSICADALNLPFEAESFDRVICSLVLYFMPLQPALFELNRVVKNGGKVYLRLPLLGWNRMIHISKTLLTNPRVSIYHFMLLMNGLHYALVGRQLSNPLLRNEHWAFYVSQRRFEQVLVKAGFLLEKFEIDRPAIYATAIDAWIRKI